MRGFSPAETFNDRFPLVGPSFWMVSIQYFIIQLIVARAWLNAYSLKLNTISDLGNTYCGPYGQRLVCSPKHSLMNTSFILLGTTMIFGSVLIYREFRQGKAAVTGFTFMGMAGLGTILVGLFPENTVGSLHLIGAALPFFIGNLGMIILGFSLRIPRSLRFYTVISGAISLLALILLISNHYLGLGPGGMERITAYPQTLWLIIFGIYMSKKHFDKRK